MAILQPWGLKALGNIGALETSGFDILLESGSVLLAEDSSLLRQE